MYAASFLCFAYCKDMSKNTCQAFVNKLSFGFFKFMTVYYQKNGHQCSLLVHKLRVRIHLFGKCLLLRFCGARTLNRCPFRPHYPCIGKDFAFK